MGYTVNTFGEVDDLSVIAPIEADSDLAFDEETGLLTWSNGEGEQRLILISDTGLSNFVPFDSVTYPVLSSAAGMVVVYRGLGEEVDLKPFLKGGVSYTIYSFAFNGQSSTEVYYRVPAVLEFIASYFDFSFDETFE